jgi:hypothetical protein
MLRSAFASAKGDDWCPAMKLAPPLAVKEERKLAS